MDSGNAYAGHLINKADETVEGRLRSLDLEQYASLFSRAGYFSVSDCTSLTESKLEDLGIALAGHRKRILKRMCGGCHADLGNSRASAASNRDAPAGADAGADACYINYSAAEGQAHALHVGASYEGLNSDPTAALPAGAAAQLPAIYEMMWLAKEGCTESPTLTLAPPLPSKKGDRRDPNEASGSRTSVANQDKANTKAEYVNISRATGHDRTPSLPDDDYRPALPPKVGSGLSDDRAACKKPALLHAADSQGLGPCPSPADRKDRVPTPRPRAAHNALAPAQSAIRVGDSGVGLRGNFARGVTHSAGHPGDLLQPGVAAIVMEGRQVAAQQSNPEASATIGSTSHAIQGTVCALRHSSSGPALVSAFTDMHVPGENVAQHLQAEPRTKAADVHDYSSAQSVKTAGDNEPQVTVISGREPSQQPSNSCSAAPEACMAEPDAAANTTQQPRSSYACSYPEPQFPPPSLPSAPLATVPLVPKRRPRVQQLAPPGQPSWERGPDLAAAGTVDSREQAANSCSAADVASVQAAFVAGSHPNNNSLSQGIAQEKGSDCFRFSTVQLLPDDPFQGIWPAKEQSLAPMAQAAVPGATLELCADDLGMAARLSDSLPIVQQLSLPTALGSVSREDAVGSLAEDADAELEESDLTSNSLYERWDVGEDKFWPEAVGEVSYTSEGSQDEGSDSGDSSHNLYCQADVLAEPPTPEESRSIVGLPLSVPSTPTLRSISRSGYLYKQGGKQNNKGWRKRYVTFDGQVLKYFSNKKDRVSKRIVHLASMLSVENDIKESDSNRFRFHLKCLNRVFWFAAETIEDSHLWASTLMQAIILAEPPGKARGGGFKPGCDMYDPDLYGNIYMDSSKNRRFVAIKGGRLCYYNNFSDFKFGSPIHQIDMEIASVKDLGKLKLQLSTPYCQYVLTFNSEDEVQLWKTAIEDSIATALSDDTVLAMVYQNESNQKCADCGCANPHWSVLHLVVVVCKKCAGIHRQIWPFNVKSLRMDLRVWTPGLVKLFVSYGNGSANSLWEWDLPPMLKISEAVDLHSRLAYIQNKYLRKAYFRQHELIRDTGELNQAFLRAVQTDCIHETIWLIHTGANVQAQDRSGRTAAELAKAAEQAVQAELLKHVSIDAEQGMVYASQCKVQAAQRVIIKSGYLTEVEKKENIRRWVVLDLEAMSYYQDENMPTLKGVIRMPEVVSIRLRENDKYLPLFSVTLLSDGGKDVTLAADSYEGLHAWMSSLYKVQVKLLRITDLVELPLPVSPPSCTNEFNMAGSVFFKEGSGASWKRTWLVLHGKVLIIYDISAQKVDEADLRKVVKMMMSKQDFSGSMSADLSGTVLVIDLPNRALYIQSDLHQDTHSWMSAIMKACRENTQSLEDQQLTRDNVAVAVDTCINFVSTYAMKVEGIYRLSGTHSAVTQLLELFIKDARSVHLRYGEHNVHDVTNALKRYLRSLTEPLMTSAMHQRWLEATAVKESSYRQVVYKGLLAALPRVNFCTLRKLIGHLKRLSELSAENKMTAANLGTVFGPLLMTSAGEAMSAAHFSQTSKEIQIVAELITCYQNLFEVDKEEIEKERKMEEYISKLQRAQQSPTTSALAAAPVFILGVYIDNRDGDSVNVKVSTQAVAKEVLAMAVPAAASAYTDICDANLSASSRLLALFEIIGRNELERQFEASDPVLKATLRWSSWVEEYRRSAYLCVKTCNTTWTIPTKTYAECVRYSEVKYYSGKSWKKVHVEVSRDILQCFKVGKSEAASVGWSVHDLVVYTGVEEKRAAPTKFGVTVLVYETDKPNEKSGPPYGHSLCFVTRADMLDWMGNIRYAKAQCGTAAWSGVARPGHNDFHGSTDNLSRDNVTVDRHKVSIFPSVSQRKQFKLGNLWK